MIDARRALRVLPAAAGLLALGCTGGPSTGAASSVAAVARPQAPDPASQPPAPVVPAGATGPAAEATTQVRAAAVIGADVVITDDEVYQLVRQQAPRYARLEGDARAKKEKEVFNEILRSLIERELIIADFTGRIKKAKPQLLEELQESTRKEAEKTLKKFKQANNLKTDEEFEKAMRSQGLSAKALTRQIERESMLNMYLQQMVRDKKKEIGLGQVEAYYRAHPDYFQVDDNVKWLDLFVAYTRFGTEQEARAYMDAQLAKVRAGEDFGEVIRRNGHGDSVLRDGEGAGGKKGQIHPRELEPTVLSLAQGQMSGVIPTATGLHVIKVTEKQVAGVRPLDEKLQTEIRQRILGELGERERLKVVEELWRKSSVKIMELQ